MMMLYAQQELRAGESLMIIIIIRIIIMKEVEN